MNTQNVTLILSASRYNLSKAENNTRTTQLIKDLRSLGLSFVECEGVFEGNSETSTMIKFAVPTKVNMIKVIADLACNDYEQDCILSIDPVTKKCWLVDNEGQQYIGQWCKVSRKEAKQTDHTYFPDADVYYTVK